MRQAPFFVCPLWVAAVIPPDICRNCPDEPSGQPMVKKKTTYSWVKTTFGLFKMALTSVIISISRDTIISIAVQRRRFCFERRASE